MSFQFVENGKVDRATRKLIRSHVMKGKNAGRTRQLREQRQEDRGLALNHNAPTSTYSGVISVPRTPGHSLSFFPFPVDEQPYMREHIYKFVSISSQSVYPEELCLPVKAAQALWFRYLLSDEACFHSILVVSESCINSMQGREEMSPRGLRHLSNTYRCINMNLQKHGAPSDATVAAVMSLAIHEDLKGQHQNSKVHLDALVGMVQLRGGITRFESTSILLQKICRADIEYALQNGSRPQLNRDNFPRNLLGSKMASLSMSQYGTFSSDNPQIYDFVLQQVFEDLMSVSCLLNHDTACFRLEPFAYQEILLSVCYRLAHRYPLSHKGYGYGNGHEELLYLGLLAFMTTLLFQHAFRRLSYPLLTERLRSAIEKSLNRSSMKDPMALWLLVVGGISVFDNADNRTWLVSHIKKYMSRLQIGTWSALRDEISEFPWFNIVHEGPSHHLWQALSS